MNRKIAERWADALESGRYEQGCIAMKYVRYNSNEAKHCVLGVLCELAVKDGVVMFFSEKDSPDMGFRRYMFDGESGKLPIKVMEWSGIKTEMGRLPCGDLLSTLSDMGMPFAKIAQIIRKYSGEI